MNDLSRFIEAQKRDYEIALSEIKAGRKYSHWIWYVFPQLKGLGRSGNSNFYGIKNIEEAIAYYQDPILGERLKEITNAFLDLPSQNPADIMGRPDDMKLKSCMTLFNEVCKQLGIQNNIFQQVIYKFFDGKFDSKTLRILEELD